MTDRAKNLLLLAVGTLLGLAAAEATVATFRPQWTAARLLSHSPGIRRSSDILPYELCKGCEGRLTRDEFDTRVTINSLGLRGAEVDLDEEVDRRVLVIGDSFTFGHGVEDHESYPVRLEEALSDYAGEGSVQVLNAGFAACYYPDTYYLWLKEFGLAFEPDLIVIGFFIGNDIDHPKAKENKWLEVDDDGLPTRIIQKDLKIEDGHLLRVEQDPRYRYPVLRDSHLFQAIASALDPGSGDVGDFASLEGLEESQEDLPAEESVAEGLAGVADEAETAPAGSSVAAADRAIARRSLHFNRWMYRAEYEERTQKAVRKVKKLLRATALLSRAHGIPILVVMIPAHEQLWPDQYAFDTVEGMEDVELGKPQRIFADFFDKYRIPYLDLLPLLRAEPDDPPLYFRQDKHFTARGNEIVAAHLASFLVEREFVAPARER